MQFVKTETELRDVNVYLNILEILMLPAGLNVSSIQIVPLTKHVKETNVLTLVLEYVVLMQYVAL